MTHLDEGTIQAYLDGELTVDGRAAVAGHILGCDACRATRDELAAVRAELGHALALLDDAAPGRVRETSPEHAAGPAARRRLVSRGAGSLVKAAALVLFLAAGAAAAVPGSPVRAWIVAAIERIDPDPPATATDEPAPIEAASAESRAAAPPAPAGIALVPAGREVVIEVEGLDGTAIRLERGTGDAVEVDVAGASRDPAFTMAAGRIGVRGGAGGTLRIVLPGTATRVRLVVDGALRAEQAGGAVTLHAPADTVDGGWLWP